ncbi:MAG: glycosyltransferase family 2 protein [Sporichthyaceae bacterium]|nr:glycosyltransferase family 2 protein [Sporichthyaceae bacterium]
MLVDVVLPCFNNADALPWVLSRIPTGFRPIVVDNGSGDGTAEVARELAAMVVVEPRHGYGYACQAGLNAASSAVVCICAADASLDPGQLPRVAGPVASGDWDLVLGRRRQVGAGAWPVYARLANLELTRRLRRRTGLHLRDLGPMRAARRCDLLGLGLTDRQSGYQLEMVVAAADAGWWISEVPVDYLPRTGRGTLTGAVRGTLAAVRDLNGVHAR